MFSITECDRASAGRAGVLSTDHGRVETPVFMPVGTRGTVKMLTPLQVKESGVEMILANTYHLMLRPTTRVIEKLGGIHSFSGWKGPLLTDSGGFQIFSLAALNKVTDEGVLFRSPIDGKQMFLTPEGVLEAQKQLGSDIAMVLDECPSASASYNEVKAAVDRTIQWAQRSIQVPSVPGQKRFGIIQGGKFRDLREKCSHALIDMDFSGYAIGGVSVGESKEIKRAVLASTAPMLPADKPRYLMGVGEPEEILEAVEQGIDMFDCVMPTRNGRNGSAFTFSGTVNVRNSVFTESAEPVDPLCTCYCCSNFSAGYLRHLFNRGEGLGPVLLSIHNIRFFMDFMKKIRQSISEKKLLVFKKDFLNRYSKRKKT